MLVLLAKNWTPKIDPTDYWLSEKLDGVRAYWTGSQFLSRNGNVFHAPEFFTQGLPPIALDGELWLGRKQFQSAVGIVKTQSGAKDEMWRDITFQVFDAPDASGAFEARMQYVEATLQGLCFAQPLSHVRCDGVDHLLQYLRDVELAGGEGVMLRAPNSAYERKRSASLLKVKTFHDAEATVTAHEPGKGKHAGRLGALVCVTAAGVPFNVGTGFRDADRAAPPAIGSRITYSYQELTESGAPRFPVFVRRFADL
ncbi:MAG: DNA ligase [Desulfurellales bacterium]|nr:MAG: DNA ligase [Desulfurellales bacterium]